MINKSTLTRRLFVAAGAAMFTLAVSAQQYPSKPIRIVLGYGAGGGMDNLARTYEPKLSQILGTTIIIDNKPGAAELLAAQGVLNSPADGYTLWLAAASGLVQGPAVRTSLPYNVQKNFTPIALVGEAQGVFVVRNELPIQNLKELVAYAKANPGKLNLGSSGIGSGNHLLAELLMAKTGIEMTHIPYKSSVENMQAAMAGQVDFSVDIVQSVVPMVLDKKVRALAVTGAQRLKSLPDVPTVAESGVAEFNGTDSFTFYGLLGPAGLPPPVVQRLNEAINKVAAMPDVAEKMRTAYSLEPYVGSTVAFEQYLQKESAKWQTLRGKVKVD